jgi:signal peptidase I
MKKNSGSKVQSPEVKAEAEAVGDAHQQSAAAPLVVRWFLSKTVRHAVAMRKHVHRILCAQRDVLTPQAAQAVIGGLDDLTSVLRAGVPKATLLKQMESLETVANKWLKPYPHSAWRENVEVLLVALAVAMGIRTFFLQPFKIPTGSMQPTLFGVTSQNLMDKPDFKIPTGFARLREWFQGVSYIDLRAKNDGALDRVGAPLRLLIFNIKQTLWIGGVPHTIWFPPDYGAPPGGTLEMRAGLQPRLDSFRKDEQVVRLRVTSGDHLFVDRMTYNFRKPSRGEIIVFETTGTPIPQKDTFYIKRLVGLGGESVQIGNDRHLIIDGQRLTASTPHFENVYYFDPQMPPEESNYSGHLNQFVASSYQKGYLAPLFPEESKKYGVPPNHYLVMGDNTVNSLDSRSWGHFAASKVIGKSYFVYWPITTGSNGRFGWGHR